MRLVPTGAELRRYGKPHCSLRQGRERAELVGGGRWAEPQVTDPVTDPKLFCLVTDLYPSGPAKNRFSAPPPKEQPQQAYSADKFCDYE